MIIRDIECNIFSALPVPWAIRFGLECRGMDCAVLPRSPCQRKEKSKNRITRFGLKDWLEKYSDCLAELVFEDPFTGDSNKLGY